MFEEDAGRRLTQFESALDFSSHFDCFIQVRIFDEGGCMTFYDL